MEWRNPWVLIWLLPAIAFWLGCYSYSIYRNASARARFLEAPMAGRLMANLSWTRIIAKAVLQTVAVVALIIALAGPQFGEQVELVVPKGSDLYVLLDVSRSMLAGDVVPSRLDRAKADITSLVNCMTGERVGLIVFAGQAVVKCPLTTDYDYFRRTLAGVDVNSAPRGGTAIGDAIRKALQVYSADAQRHQAILLITDGDDHSSAPLEAADYAAERQVKVFAVGLGDAEQGARVPDRQATSQFMEHNGQQVWSKLDSSLLEKIATRTSGVYIPVGTKSYDLKEIYTNYLAKQESEEGGSQTRLRRAEQFQWFLAIAVFAFLSDLIIKPFSRKPQIGQAGESIVDSLLPSGRRWISNASALMLVIEVLSFSLSFSQSSKVCADDAKSRVLEGLSLYRQEKFAEASQAFAAAGDFYREVKDDLSFIAVYDQACAEHRQGNHDKAAELYLQAAMARDKGLAAKASFNLGRLHVEAAQKIAQQQDLITDAQQRERVVESIKQSIAAYRQSLELDPQNSEARRNIELVRQWLKVTLDQWREADLMKRRKELDLIQFLDYLIGVQDGILIQSQHLKDLHALDQYAELKRLQEELLDELPYLKDKIEDSLSPPPEERQQPPPSPNPETTEAIKLLQSWVDIAGQRMRNSAAGLGRYRSSESVKAQLEAIEELDKVWNAVSPFALTLDRSLAVQTEIAKVFQDDQTDQSDQLDQTDQSDRSDQKHRWFQQQTRNLARAKMLEPKAAAQIAGLKQTEPRAQDVPSEQPEIAEEPELAQQPHRPNTEETIKGLEKAIELSPAAVAEMQSALESMRQNDDQKATKHAEEARRILEEIASNQPKPPQDQNSKQDDQNQQNQTDQNQMDQQQHNQGQQEKDQEKDKSDSKSQEEQQEQEQREQENENTKENEQQRSESQAREAKRPSQDRIAETLRKVREREAQKRERDRQFREYFSGQVTVEKDW